MQTDKPPKQKSIPICVFKIKQNEETQKTNKQTRQIQNQSKTIWGGNNYAWKTLPLPIQRGGQWLSGEGFWIGQGEFSTHSFVFVVFVVLLLFLIVFDWF